MDSENCSCPLSQKPVQKRFLPQQRGSLSVEGVFAKKIFRCGRGFRCRRLRSAAVTRLWPRLGLRRGWCIHIAWLSGHVSPPATRSRRTRAAALPRSAAAKQDCAFGPLAIPTPEPHIACAAERSYRTLHGCDAYHEMSPRVRGFTVASRAVSQCARTGRSFNRCG